MDLLRIQAILLSLTYGLGIFAAFTALLIISQTEAHAQCFKALGLFH